MINNVLVTALLIDNAPSDPGELQLKFEDGNIFAKNASQCTALTQPMDKSAIASTEENAELNFLSKETEEPDDLKNFFKDFTILHSI